MRRYAIQAGLALLALTLAAAPFAIAWYLHVLGLQVSEQHATPAAVLTPNQLADAEAVRSKLPTHTPPVVLCYHDIRPLGPTEHHPDPRDNPANHFVVTPEEFDAQLTALKAAGYTSLTSDQYLNYLAGGPVPERSVLITFDDGTHGLWTHADKILERHGMHGVAFLITGNVGAKRPYYLSWQEIDRMAASGRWDFQSHTHKMHARLPVNAEGTVASEMVHRRWLFEANRPETLDEFESKIREDLARSITDIVDHELPRPTLFAFPFSEGFREFQSGDPYSSDPEAAAVSARLVNEMFEGAFNNAPPLPSPAGARAATAGMVGRIEITLDTTVEELLDKLLAYTPLTPEQAPPAKRPDLWINADNTREFIDARGNEVRILDPGTWEAIRYGPFATADWAAYQATVTVHGLAADGVENASLVARVDSGNEVSAQVSSDYFRLTVERGSESVTIGQLELAPSDQHTLVVTVSPTSTDVVVDGTFALSTPADGKPSSYGGIGLTSSRTTTTAPWPIFTDLSVTAGPDTPNVRSGVGVPLPR